MQKWNTNISNLNAYLHNKIYIDENYVYKKHDHRHKLPATKLTWKIVKEIRKIYSEQLVTYVELGEKFGIADAVVSNIVNNIAWYDPDYKKENKINNTAPEPKKELEFNKIKKYRNEKLTLEKFLLKANERHSNYYDYSNIKEYINNNQKVDIICPNHGVFNQKIMKHLQGQGCKKCNMRKSR